MSEQENYIEVLIDTLKKQEEVLGKIYAITKEQSEIAEASEFDELMLEDTLNRKEILIAKLNELDAGFTSVYGRVRAEIREHQEQYKEEVLKMQKLIKECTDIGVAIKVLEERNRDKMMQCFSNQYKKYSAKRTAASVASQYNQTMKSGNVANSYFMDKKN